MRGQSLPDGRSVDECDERLERAEAENVFDMSRLEQAVRHVEHEQCRHAIIGKTLPQFGEGEPAEAHWVADERDVAALRRHRYAVVHRTPEIVAMSGKSARHSLGAHAGSAS